MRMGSLEGTARRDLVDPTPPRHYLVYVSGSNPFSDLYPSLFLPIWPAHDHWHSEFNMAAPHNTDGLDINLVIRGGDEAHRRNQAILQATIERMARQRRQRMQQQQDQQQDQQGQQQDQQQDQQQLEQYQKWEQQRLRDEQYLERLHQKQREQARERWRQMQQEEQELGIDLEQRLQQLQQRTRDYACGPDLYAKAQDHQGQLTQEERNLLLGRGDITGRVLGAPDSLTDDEIHVFLNLPPPDVVRANVQRATGGSLGTVSELYAKVKDAVERGEFDTLVSLDEVRLIMRRFRADEPEHPLSARAGYYSRFGEPGNGQAATLLERRLGMQDAAVTAALTARHRANPLPPPPPGPVPDPAFLLRLARLKTDRDSGAYVWAETAERRDPWDLFREDTGLGGFDLAVQWEEKLSEEEREAYRARSAALRRESWVEFERFLAERARQPPRPAGSVPIREGEPLPKFPPTYVSAFEVFRDELEAGVEYWDAVERWLALSERRRRAYGEKTVPLNATARLAWNVVLQNVWYTEGQMVYRGTNIRGVPTQ